MDGFKCACTQLGAGFRDMKCDATAALATFRTCVYSSKDELTAAGARGVTSPGGPVSRVPGYFEAIIPIL